MGDESHADDAGRDIPGSWPGYLREVIARPGWTVKRLATESGVHRSTIFRWLNGNVRNVTIESVRAIGRAVGDESRAVWAAGDVLPDQVDSDRAEASRLFAETLIEGREHKGWTTGDLAIAADTPEGMIRRWEEGDVGRPYPEFVRRVFRALGIDVREAIVLLGYASREELGLPVERPRSFAPTTEAAISILEDPNVSDADKVEALEYLRFRARRTGTEQAG